MRFKLSFLYITLALISSTAAIATTTTEPFDYPKVLGWIPAPNNIYNLCNGYYRDLPIPYIPNPMLKDQTNTYDITADKVTYLTHGTSTLKGNVRITKPGEQMNANLAYLDRNPTTGKIEVARAYGNVRLFEPGKLLVAKSGRLNLANNTMFLKQTAYRMEAQPNPTQQVQPVTLTVKNKGGNTEYRRYGMTYWGHAKTITQTQPHRFVLTHSTYTTCPPGKSCAWHLAAKTVHINNDTGVGDAWNSVLWVKNIPIFYFPYVNFPLNHDRKSGFLSPTYGHNQTSGTMVSTPYYWNIAPNYDALFTPEYLSERGFMGSGLFRYLTANSSGRLNASFLPNDRAFASFKKSAAVNPIYIANQPQGLHNLEEDSNNRYSVYWQDLRQYNLHWSSMVSYHKVSDSYYIQNLGNLKILNNSQNQLLQQGQIQYQGMNWQVLGLLQNYQTLHPINQSAVSNQYARLPQLSASGFYPNIKDNFNFSINTSAIKFAEDRNPDQPTQPAPVTGGRLNINPMLEYPINEVYGYLTPSVQLELTQYDLSHEGAHMPSSPSNGLPIFNVHGGLFFDRYFNWFHHLYRQTLEPEAYYLYVPYHNQNNLPAFDTTTQNFDYSFLFFNNRFSGVDRIGDANQITLATTSRLINIINGDQIGSISIGEIVYFQDRRVTLCQPGQTNCSPGPLDRRALSPIASQATYNITNNWTGSAYLTWDQYAHTFSNETANLNYTHNRHLFNIGYSLVRNGGVLAGQDNNDDATKLQQLNLSGEWLLAKHWDLLGRWSYSWTGSANTDHANAYLAGIEYDSCCWGIRLIESRTFLGISAPPQNKNMFNNEVYLEADLHGLGSIGTDDPSKLLKSSITNYQDPFEPEVL